MYTSIIKISYSTSCITRCCPGEMGQQYLTLPKGSLASKKQTVISHNYKVIFGPKRPQHLYAHKQSTSAEGFIVIAPNASVLVCLPCVIAANFANIKLYLKALSVKAYIRKIGPC